MWLNERKDALSEVMSENKESPAFNDRIMLEEKSTCKDKLSKKKCQKLKKKNKGKGCENEATQKKCKNTCGLCGVGKLGFIDYLTNF